MRVASAIPAGLPQAARSRIRASGTCLMLCASVFLVACSSLPKFVPDLARRDGDAIRMAGTSGMLSPAQTRAILKRLADKGEATDILQRHLAVEQAIVGSPLSTGNRVTLLKDGPATYESMLAAIAQASDHINMETYILDDDEVGKRFADALIDKQRQGVQVNLIHDSVGTLGTPDAFFARLRDNGVRVLEFNPVNPLQAKKGWELNHRDHRKLLIVDGTTAFLGGINISGVYSSGSSGGSSRLGRAARAPGPQWRDTDIRIDGPVVADFQKLFMATWQSQKGDPLEARNYYPRQQAVGDQVVRAIGSSPDDHYSLIYATLLSAIHSAERSVQLTNAYFAPDPQLLDALESAARRGVDVRLILPKETDSWLVFHAGRGYYARLLHAGVRIDERRGVILHSKTGLVDGVWATVGSTNLDWRSFLHNSELNAVVLGSAFGDQVQAMFNQDLAQSDEITLAQWERRSLDLRVKELLARAWEYWL